MKADCGLGVNVGNGVTNGVMTIDASGVIGSGVKVAKGVTVACDTISCGVIIGEIGESVGAGAGGQATKNSARTLFIINTLLVWPMFLDS